MILFDLGGVLVDWDGVAPLVNLTNGKITPEQARRFWLESLWVKRFETGQCSELDFSTGVIHDLSLDLTPGEFIKKFSAGIAAHSKEHLKFLMDYKKILTFIA